MRTEPSFAVLDLETTGVLARTDRIVEIAVVHVDADGEPTETYCTLIDPRRDIGPTHIHGISAGDVLSAPLFEEVLGDVAERLRGAIVVGHNVRFDLQFLRSEAGRAKYDLPEIPAICTLHLSHRLGLALPSRRLAACCEEAGIETENHHSALHDALATARLFRHYLGLAKAAGKSSLDDLGCRPDAGIPYPWPPCPASGRRLARAEAAANLAAQEDGIRRLLERLESPPDTDAGTAAYFDVLDRVLEDRRITDDEVEALYRTARLWNLGPKQVRAAHRSYVRALADAALGDGHISAAERSDLVRVADLLDISEGEFASVMEEAKLACSTAVEQSGLAATKSGHDLWGKSVCFTGALSARLNGERVTRTVAESLADAAGLLVRNRVTTDLDILVVADPHTQSSKAKQARKSGTRILAEMELWRQLGVAVS